MSERLIVVVAPLIIGPRLVPALRIEGATLSLDAIERDAEGRVVYRWWIDLPDGTTHTGADLRSGCLSPVDYRATMASLLSFLSACGESDEGGENFDLFPAPVQDWCQTNSDELQMLSIELEEGS